MPQLEFEYLNNKDKPGSSLGYRSKTVLSLGALMLAIAAFLTSRAVIFGIMAPFGIAMVAASSGTVKKRATVAVFSAIGIITLRGGELEPAKYMSVLIVFLAVQVLVGKTRFKVPDALSAAVSMLAVGTAAIFLNHIVPYDMAMLLLECVICYVSVLIFERAVFLSESIAENRVAAAEESVSLCIAIGVCILGFSQVSLPWNISISNMLCALVILLVAINSTVSATLAGLGCGVISSINSFPLTDSMGFYALCGIGTGLFKRFGKAGITFGFVACNALFAMYFNGTRDVVFNVYEQFIALAIMWIIPLNNIRQIGEIVGSGIPADDLEDKIRAVVTGRLAGVSAAFDSLADSLHKLSKWSGPPGADITVVFDEAANRVCRRCPDCFRCWQHEFNTTYGSLMHAAPVLEEYGSIEVSNLPNYFVNKCKKIDVYVAEVNKQYDSYRVESIWQQKIDNSRRMVTEQLLDVSKIVSGVSEELMSEIYFDAQMEREIRQMLKERGINVGEMAVIHNGNGRWEVDVKGYACGGHAVCGEEMLPIISQAIDLPMALMKSVCGKEKNKLHCTLRFIEQTPLSVECGAARLPKDGQEESGDNFCHMHIKENKYIIAISDGMGSGKKAASQSNTAVELLGRFLDAGFEKESAIKLINSVLLLRSADETFATIDMAIIDLLSGVTEFIKIGANTTYIKHKRNVEAITSSSLPAGILGEVDIEAHVKTVQKDDYIIMLSDGIENVQDLWVAEYLTNMDACSPGLLAEKLLKQARMRCDGGLDDMTVVVGRLKGA